MKKLFTTLKTLGIAAIMLTMVGVAFTQSSFVHASNYPITGQNYFLAGAGVTSSQTTVPLTAFKTPDGRPITMTMIGTTGYGTLEPQSPAKTELIKFTGVTQNGNGSAVLTGVTRGIDFAYPYTASTTLRQAHSGGATFIISNTPNWYYDNFPIQGDDNVTVWPTASTSVPSRGYVDYVAFNGAGVINATTAAKGVVQLATGAQAAASTAAGSSGASLILTSAIATSTFNTSTAGNVIPVTNVSGKIDSQFIATSTLYTNASFATTTTIGSFPAWQIGKQMQMFTSTGTSTFSVPSGITNVCYELVGAGGGGGANSGGSALGGGGGGGGYANGCANLTGTSTIQIFIGTGGGINNNAAGTAGTWSTFGTNGFYSSGNGGTGGGVSLGGAGATATNSNGIGYVISGQKGQAGSGTSVGGFGGNSMLGFGSDPNTGTVGVGFGSGGGAGVVSQAGVGANGALILRW